VKEPHLCEGTSPLPRGREKRILGEVLDAFAGWHDLAKELDIPQRLIAHVGSTLRMQWV